MSSAIPVIYSFDKGYAQYAAVSTFSLASSTKSSLRIYWVVPQEDEESVIPVLKAVEQKTGQSITLVTVSPEHFEDWNTLHYISRSTYLRLIVPTVIDEPLAIYLDADTLVLSDLGPLFSMDLGDHMIAGVMDPGAGDSKLQRPAGDPYLNVGALLMNLEALRQDGLLEKAKALYRAHESELTYLDQCLLNKCTEGRKLVVDTRWNRLTFSYAMPESQFGRMLIEEEPAVLHFLTSIKPWQRWCTPEAFNFWWYYADRLGLEGLRPQKVTAATVNQALSVVNFLGANERFREASSIKDKIIADLTEIAHSNTAAV